jgi:adenosylmethionine---8-amino-7-oxononanoate aminotransferase
VAEVRTLGLVAGIELVAQKSPRRPFPWQEQRGMKACLAARQHGALLRPLGDVVVLWPPLSVTPDEIDHLCAAAAAGIREATGT